MVVPTAQILPPLFFVSAIASTVSSEILKYSSMDPVAGDILFAHRGKGPVADMQGDLAERGCLVSDGPQQLVGKMQAGGRGGHRPGVAGINGLIALDILGGAAVLLVRYTAARVPGRSV